MAKKKTKAGLSTWYLKCVLISWFLRKRKQTENQDFIYHSAESETVCLDVWFGKDKMTQNEMLWNEVVEPTVQPPAQFAIWILCVCRRLQNMQYLCRQRKTKGFFEFCRGSKGIPPLHPSKQNFVRKVRIIRIWNWAYRITQKRLRCAFEKTSDKGQF